MIWEKFLELVGLVKSWPQHGRKTICRWVIFLAVFSCVFHQKLCRVWRLLVSWRLGWFQKIFPAKTKDKTDDGLTLKTSSFDFFLLWPIFPYFYQLSCEIQCVTKFSLETSLLLKTNSDCFFLRWRLNLYTKVQSKNLERLVKCITWRD